MTEGSSNYGSSWQGPYLSGPVMGAIENLSVTTSPAGLAYAVWSSSALGTGTPEEAIYFADGSLMLAPSAVPLGPGGALSPSAGPAIAVDAFQRPLIAWPASNASTSGIAFTGDYLTANETLSQVDQMVVDPLALGDFAPGSGKTTQAAFNTSISKAVSEVSTNLSSNKLCDAQNASVYGLYQNLTHLPLTIVPGSGTVCSSNLVPNNKTSPLTTSVGIDSPNTYLAVYADWLLEALGVPLAASPLANATGSWGPIASASAPPPWSKIADFNANSGCSGAGWSVCQADEQVEVSSTMYSPTALNLVPSTVFPSSSLYDPATLVCRNLDEDEGFWANYTLVKTWSNVSIDNGTVHSFIGTGFYPSIYVANLTVGSSYYWNLTLSPRFQLTEGGSLCGHGQAPPTPFSAAKTSFSGVVSTTLALSSMSHSWHVYYTNQQNAAPVSVGIGFVSNIETVANATVTTGSTTVATWASSHSAYLPATTGAMSFQGVVGDTYEVSVVALTRPGGWTTAQLPSFSYATPTSAPAQTSSYSFSMTLTKPSITLSGWTTSNVTSTTAQLTWLANADGGGTVTYSANNSGENITAIGILGASASGNWRYTIELHGLEPWTVYVGSFGVVTANATYTYYFSEPFSPFQTAVGVIITESDYPYDSITHTGGGGSFHWNLPNAFSGMSPLPRVMNGTLLIWNSSQTISVPVSSSEVNQTKSSSWFDTFNFTLAGLNVTYGVLLELNYSTNPVTFVTSQDLNFTYQKDTSGDGLTDLEKVNGWVVPVNGFAGIYLADPDAFSTNGLVSDYFEKLYDLDPWTVDTASSHMIDLWNLTFDLGNASQPVSIPDSFGFHLWWENNTSFYPFSFAQYPGGRPLGQPVNPTPWGNISCTSTGCPGSYEYSSNVLWSRQALTTFLSFPGLSGVTYWKTDWLRGVIASYGGTWYLTLWGKLSWGANPDYSVTPAGTTLPDGNRISPLGLDRLSVEVNNLYVSGLQTGLGYAVRLRVFPGTTSTGNWTLSNYTAPVGGVISRLTGYDVCLPVNPTAQFETIQLQIFANESGTSTLTPINFLLVNGEPAAETNVTYDMLLGQAVAYTYGSNVPSPNGSLSMVLQSLTVGGKTPTYLWLPTDNSTVNGLPAGLERYTGEQSFDLVIINASTSLNSSSIPFPWGGSYVLSLQPGLNNLLLPREQFLNSSFAAAILQGKDFPYPSGHPTPPILSGDTKAQNLLTKSFGSVSGLMFDLQAYWQNRSVSRGPFNFTTAETGVSNSSSLQIRTLVVQTPPSYNTGGLLSDPGLYSSVPQPPALQSIFTLNITSTATLDLLLAALLTNTTAGVNGTFQPVTNQVSSLGFEPAVINALANAPIGGQGLFGPPPYNPKSTSGGGPWGDFVNAVTSIVTTVAGAVMSLVNVVWTATVAAFTYLDHMAIEAAAIGGTLLSRTAATLVSVGKAIGNALNALLDYIVSLVKAALASVIDPIVRAAASFDSTLGSAANATVADVNGGGGVTAAHALAWGQAFDPIAILGVAVAFAITVALVILGPLDLGAGFIVPLILTIVPTFSQNLISGLASISSFTAQAVATLEDSFTNSLPKAEWEAVAGVAALTASSTDFFIALLTAAQKGLTEQIAATLALSIIVDLAVFAIGVVTWASHLGAVAIAALVLAGIAAFVAFRALVGGIASIKTYATISVVLAGIGVAAASADVILAET